MFDVDWRCPKCDNVNTDDAVKAADYTCVCDKCGAECEVYFEVDINITEVKAI